MATRPTNLSAGALLLLCLPLPALSAETPAAPAGEPPVYRLEVHTIKPGKSQVYESAVTAFVAALRDADIRIPSWDFSVLRSSDTLYMTVDPMADWSMLDHFDSDTEDARKRLGGRMGDFLKQSLGTNAHESEFFIESDPDKDDPGALGENGLNFIRLDLYYPSSMRPLVEDLYALRKLYRDSGSGLNFRLYGAVTGEDLPLMIVAVSAADHAAFDAGQARFRADSVAERSRLLAEIHGLSRRFETMDFVVRPDLSYHFEAAGSPQPANGPAHP
jgi:hypothetical protein